MKQNPSRKRPTILDVASLAGVSYATVSRYLNGRPNVAPAAAESIAKAVEELHYVPNRTARALVNQSTRQVAFVVRTEGDLFFSDANLSRMAAGFQAHFDDHEYLVLYALANSPEADRRIISLIRGGAVDGAVLAAMNVDDPVFSALLGSPIPIVTSSKIVEGQTVPWVDAPNRESEAKLVRELLKTGRTNPLVIKGPDGAPSVPLRFGGIVDALGWTPDSERVATARDWTSDSGVACMRELLARDLEFDSVIALADVLAAGAVSVLRASGIRIPEAVAVVGFDDSPIASVTRPPLTTVRQNSREVGRRLADLLHRQIDGEDLSGVTELVPMELVWRESAGPRSS